MAKAFVREIGIKFNIDTSTAAANVERLDKSISRIKSEIGTLKSSLKIEWDGAKFNRAMELAQEKTKLAAQRADELKGIMAALEQQGVDRTADEFRKLEKEVSFAETAVIRAQKEVKELNQLKIDHLTKRFDDLEKKLSGMGKAFMPVSLGAAAGLTLATKAAIDMESAMAGVAKTTDLSGAELDKMKEATIALSKEIPVAATELAKIEENAGQLGIQKENILSFTRTIADLGVATNMAGEEAAQTLAKFANITQMPQTQFGNLGSAIVDLGNNSATTEKDIADMGMRIAAAGTQAGMTQAEIMGLAAAASSVGLEAEAGGTAFSKTINAINLSVQTGNEQLREFASIAGMSAEQFKSAWSDDAAGAFVRFIEGLDDAGGSAIVTLEKLGFDAERQRDALSRAAISGDTFRASIERASKAWADNIALSKEAQTRYETTASKLQLLKNEVTALGIEVGDHILPTLTNGAKVVGDVVKWLADLDKATGGLLGKIGLFTALLGPALTIAGKVNGLISTMVTTYQTLSIALRTKQAADAGATASQTALNTAMAANPAGAVATAIGVVVSAVVALIGTLAIAGDSQENYNQTLKDMIQAQEEAEKSINQTRDDRIAELGVIENLLPKIEEMNSKTNRTATEQAALNGMVAQANEIVPGLIGGYNELTGKYDLNTSAITRNIGALKTKYALEANEDIIKEKIINIEGLKEKLDDAEQSLQNQSTHLSARTVAVAISGSPAVLQSIMENAEAVKGFREEIDKETAALDGLYEVVAEQYGQLDGVFDSVSKGAESAADAATDYGGAVEAMRQATDEATKSASSMNSELGMLSDAFAEQSQNGELSLDTTLKLIEAGYASALSIDAETGAVTLNKDAFLLCASAKLQDQLASTQKIKSEIVARLDNEAAAARNAATAFSSAAYAKLLLSANMGTGADQMAQASATEATIQKMLDNLGKVPTGSYSGSVPKSSGGGGGSKKDPQVEAYQKARKDLEYERDMEMISQEQYYKRLRALQSKYLKENSDEWKKVNVELHNWDKKKSDEQGRAGVEAYKKAREDLEYQRDMEEISQQEFYQRLAEVQTKHLQKGSDEWRKVNIELYKWQRKQWDDLIASTEKAAEDRQTAEDKAWDKAQKAAEDRYRQRCDQIDRELAAEKERLQAIIDNIDRELAERERLKEEAGFDKRIAALQLQIDFERDADNKINLEKQMLQLQNDKAEWAYQQEKQAEKQAAQDAMAVAEKVAEQRKEDAKNQIAYDTTEFYNKAASSGKINREEFAAALRAADSAASMSPSSTVSTSNTDNRVFSAPITLVAGVTSGQIAAAATKVFERLMEG